jgi:PAS domain S-box-containing protein
MIQKAMQDGSVSFEWTHKRNNGTDFPATVLLTKMAVSGKGVLQARVRDISSEVESMEKIRLFERGFDTSPDSQILVDYLDGKPIIVKVNASFTKYYGYTSKEVAGKNPKLLKSGAQKKAYYKGMWAALLDPKVGYWRDEIINRRKDGGKLEVLLVVNTIFDKDGKPRAFLASHVDISRQKQTERALAASKQFQQSALDAIRDSFFVCDASGRFLSWNKEFRDATGYSDKEIAKMSVTGFFSGKDLVRVADAIRKGIGKGSAKVSANVIAKGGQRLPTEFSGAVMRDPKGKITGFAGIGRRLTVAEYERASQE